MPDLIFIPLADYDDLNPKGSDFTSAVNLIDAEIDDLVDLADGVQYAALGRVTINGNATYTQIAAPAPAITKEYLSMSAATVTNNNSTTVNLTGVLAGQMLYFVVHKQGGGGLDPTAPLSLGGVPAALEGYVGIGATASYVYRIACPAGVAGSASATVLWAPTTGGGSYHCAVWKVTGTVTTTNVYTASTTGGPGSETLVVSGNTGVGVVLVGFGLRSGARTGQVGITPRANAANGTTSDWEYLDADTVVATPRAMSLTRDSTAEGATGIAIALS